MGCLKEYAVFILSISLTLVWWACLLVIYQWATPLYLAEIHPFPASPANPIICTTLIPSSGAVVYYPNVWAPGVIPPFASANTTSDTLAFWHSEWCSGGEAVSALFDLHTPGLSGVLENALKAWDMLNSPSMANDFHLPLGQQRKEYCDGCEGVLRFSRQQGCVTTEGPNLKGDTKGPLYDHASALGPDELWVTLEGAEFHVLPALHLGNCSYALPYAVTLPGLYRLHAYALRADYASLDEIKYADHFPPLTLDSILGSKLLIQLGSASTGDQDAARAKVLGPLVASSDLGPRTPALPSCSASTLNEGGLGRYVRKVPTTPATFAPDQPPFSMPLNLGSQPMSFFVQLQDEYEFLPYACRRPPFDASRTAARCFSSRKVNFRGDSQMRVFYNHIMQRVCGVPLAAIKGAWQESTCIFNTSLCQDALVCLMADPLAETLENITSFDVVAVNFGQHQASQHRTPAAVYRQKITEYFDVFADLAGPQWRSTHKLLWFETQTLCISNRDYLHSFGDWRTPHRVSLYNRVARGALLESPRGKRVDSVVPLSHPQLPMSQLCHDTGHLIGVQNALDAMLWAALDAICPGWDAP